MDGDQFDAIARSLAARQTRRGVARLLAAAGALALGAIPVRGRAGFTCSYIGCGCATGTLHPCNAPLVCCPSTPGTPGEAGVCSNASDCDAPCRPSGGYCSDSCNWGDACPECCSGYCGSSGACV
ncbi:MAG: hypothetical protein IT338_01185 [Thermomicrobiales bacterium]|nr:hypothetical protein [Thermomicrobiales bacterium]